MENGPAKKRIWIIIIAAVLLITAAVAYIYTRNSGSEEVSFSENERVFFQMFGREFSDSSEYRIKSLDAYYYDDGEKEGFPSSYPTGTYFFRVVYSFYFDVEDEWYDVDEVKYGSYGKIDNMYCLSWDSLSGFEEVNRKFQLAVEEGTHKSYDVSKFAEYIEKYRDQD